MIRPRTAFRLLLAAGLAALAAACSSIEVRSQSAGEPVSASSWAWLEPEPRGLRDAPELEIRAAIETGLAGMGLRRTEPGEADVLVAYTTRVETEFRQNDPYFTMYASEEYEVGTLAIELYDPASGKRIWRGVGSSQLRVSAVLSGMYSADLTPTDAPRNWRVSEKVSLILGQLKTGSGGVRLVSS